jgi:hypothetical protein
VAAFSTAATALAAGTTSALMAPWTALYAARTTARQDDLALPLAELARFQRAGDPASVHPALNLAASESAYRAALAQAGRALAGQEAQRATAGSILQCDGGRPVAIFREFSDCS